MGCDIHAFVEYKKSGTDYGWWGLGGQMHLSRDYDVFSRLAGVRNYSGKPPVVEPRGVPEDSSYQVRTGWYLYVNDSLADSEGYTSVENALRWKEYGCEVITDADGNPDKVQHPDWHTPSWVTPSEFAQALEAAQDPVRGPPHDDYYAILAAMKALEERNNEVRLVFWFDN